MISRGGLGEIQRAVALAKFIAIYVFLLDYIQNDGSNQRKIFTLG